jgi:hypothetical protein
MGVYLAGGALGSSADSEQNFHPHGVLTPPGTAWKRPFQFVRILVTAARSSGKIGRAPTNTIVVKELTFR